MQFTTQIQLTEYKSIDHNSKILNIGSCFAENIGNKLIESRFNIINNPNGIVYNPITISEILTHIIDNSEYQESDLIHNGGLWHSILHHGKFSGPDKQIVLSTINSNLHNHHEFIKTTTHIIITFGSSVVYDYMGRTAGNCHKLPNKLFKERQLSIDEIVNTTSEVIDKIKSINNDIQIIITISPVRYAGKGMHNNQINKATLLLATEELCKKYELIYFPSFEIVLDELRDYRYFAEDMIHPSETAVRYIWERFCDSMLTKECNRLLPEIEKINKSINHRPLHPESEEYRTFLMNLEKEIKILRTKYPNIIF